MSKSDFKYIKDVFHKLCNSYFFKNIFIGLKGSSLLNFEDYFFIRIWSTYIQFFIEDYRILSAAFLLNLL